MALWAITQRQRYLAPFGLARQSRHIPFWVGSAEPAHTFWVGSAEPAHTENADFISAGGFAPSLGASKRCVLQAFAMQMRV